MTGQMFDPVIPPPAPPTAKPLDITKICKYLRKSLEILHKFKTLLPPFLLYNTPMGNEFKC
jgi:hypothetical protein